MKKWKLIFCVMVLGTVTSWGQTSISGKVVDEETGEELIGANVLFYQSGVYKTGVSTDYDGNYQLVLEAGTYDVEATYIGYPSTKITGVVIKEGRNNSLTLKLPEQYEVFEYIYSISKCFLIPLIDKHNTTTGLITKSREVKRGSGKQINDIIIAAPGISWSR